MDSELFSIIVWGFFVWSVWEWQAANAEMWAVSLVPLFVLTTMYFEYYKFLTYPKTELNNCASYNDNTGICPFNGYMLSLTFRILGLLFAIVQIFVIKDIENDDWNKYIQNIGNHNIESFERYYIYAFIGSLCYTLSGVVQCIALCQCGIQFDPSEKLKLLSWGIHDIVLGGIWIALSVQFQDVIDDKDDSHWRSLFSSMIIFHILSILFEIWNNKSYSITWFNRGFRICSPQTKKPLLMFVRFLLYCVIYFWILMRLHSHDKMLISLSWNYGAAETITISAIIIVIINFLDDETHQQIQTISKKTARGNASSLYF